jgi:spermidine/putrescine transport system substrate-binding protein
MLENGGVGKVDVAITNHAYMRPSIEAGLLQPIDVAKITTYSQLYPSLRNLASLHSGGKTYGVPWEWGLTTLAYNPSASGGPVTSWNALWSSKFAGKVTIFDDPQTAVETAAFYLHENPAKPNLDKVHAALTQLKKNVKVLWGSANDWTRAFSTGQVVVGNAWSSLPAQLSKPKIKLVVPKAGAVGWLDSWTIVKNAPHLALAYAWINYMTGVSFQKRFSQDPSHEAAGPANSVALKKLPAATLTKLGANPTWLPRLDFVQISADQLKAWTQLWETVKAGG